MAGADGMREGWWERGQRCTGPEHVGAVGCCNDFAFATNKMGRYCGASKYCQNI